MLITYKCPDEKFSDGDSPFEFLMLSGKIDNVLHNMSNSSPIGNAAVVSIV